jgi:hypothetical protein
VIAQRVSEGAFRTPLRSKDVPLRCRSGPIALVGRGARSATGIAELPLGVAVEIEAVVRVVT